MNKKGSIVLWITIGFILLGIVLVIIGLYLKSR